MKDILNYDLKIVNEGGAFVKPNNEVIPACYNHEGYAKDFCNGYYYKFIEDIKKGITGFTFPIFEDIKKIYGYDGDIENMDIYLSSKLTSIELRLYKKWLQLEKEKLKLDGLASEFLTRVLNWDKILTIGKNEITTTRPNPYYTYWNYYLMGFDIVASNPLTFNNLKNIFEESLNDEYLSLREKDNLLKTEADEIKSKCKRKDIEEFFR